MKAASEVSASRAVSLTEYLILLFLVVAAIVLAFVYFRVQHDPSRVEPQAFDLTNPMLDAQPDECVLLRSKTDSGDPVCVRVREPSVVIRPRRGPARLGSYGDLHRRRPYLATGLRFPPPGRGCADAVSGREEVELFDLNGFGMPYGISVALESIRPMWLQIGVRYLFVYEVQLRQYGIASHTWFVYLHEGAPVTGAVLRRYTTPRHQMHETDFLPADDC